MWLGVWDQNVKAIEFYRRQGLSEFSKHDFLLGNDQQTDILMKLKL
jgi:ribosomal protein S18 acetylase RimI-like enzyme